jgi:UDP-N-acetyl-D-mannosaminuronic acid transferase (WecB/TagA/CpsF family)
LVQSNSDLTNAPPFQVITPNANFLVTSQSNSAFRETMLLRDLCLADGYASDLDRQAAADSHQRSALQRGSVRQAEVNQW